MELKIDAQKIVQHRKSRVWSQQQLAEVAGLSLRTVQRIETTGQASHDSIQALAASFGLQPNELFTKQPRPRRAAYAAGSMIMAAVVLAIVMAPSVFAQPVMLNVALQSEGDVLASASLLSDEGRESELLIQDVLKIVLKSQVNEKREVLVTVKLFESVGQGEYTLLAEPAVLAAAKKMASLEFESSSGRRFGLQITPVL